MEILVSWYGITDFKSSLGLEASGPLSSAITSLHFDEVQLLGYTDSNKVNSKEFNDEAFQAELDNIDKTNTAEANRFVYRWANTEQAHKYFLDFLQGVACKVNKKLTVGFTPVNLKMLNDTEGIYAASANVLETIATKAKYGEVFVSVFLSPGTPVMAFCWAMAVLKFSKIKKRLIASPDPRNPPEIINLPQEWLEWYGKQLPKTQGLENFDIVFHLFGEQRMPTYLGVKQFECLHHVFIVSDKFTAVDTMKQFVSDKTQLSEIKVEPYSPKDIQQKILEFIKENYENKDKRIGFNLTGGTKLMYAGALNVCRQLAGVPFYFDTNNRRVIFLGDFSERAMVKVKRLDEFIKLNGQGLIVSQNYQKNRDLEKRSNITCEVWKNRKQFKRCVEKILKENFQLQKPLKEIGFTISMAKEKESKPYIAVAGKATSFNDDVSFKNFLKGGWFEEYVYYQLQELLQENIIIDIKPSTNLRLLNEANENATYTSNTYQEFDTMFTDGYRLYIVECKTGKIDGEQINKLESLVRQYGGIEGRGILLYSNNYTPNDALSKKISESKNVKVFFGDNIIEETTKYIKSLNKVSTEVESNTSNIIIENLNHKEKDYGI